MFFVAHLKIFAGVTGRGKVTYEPSPFEILNSVFLHNCMFPGKTPDPQEFLSESVSYRRKAEFFSHL